MYNNVFSTIISILPFFANKNYYSSINIQYIALFSIYKFTINFNKLQNTLKMEIFVI